MATDNTSDELEIIVVEPNLKPANAAMIWLHGLGADGSDFIEIAEQLGLPDNHRVRFLFPNAPVRPITINNNMQMRGWYNIFDLTLTAKEDASGIRHSAQLINNLINQEIDSGILSSKIIIAGFSQGAAMALHTGLRHPRQLGGIIALSGYMPLTLSRAHANKRSGYQTNSIASKNEILHAANTTTPIFMAHGLSDPVVPYSVGEDSYEYLTDLTYNVQWQSYQMPHTLCLEELNDIGLFVRKILTY